MQDYETIFKSARYILDDNRLSPKVLEIHIDKMNIELDHFLRPAQTWAFITAWNPFLLEGVLGDKENKARNETLKERVLNAGFQCYQGYGESQDKSWREDSFLVTGITRGEAIPLASDFGQKGILYGERNKKAELIILSIR